VNSKKQTTEQDSDQPTEQETLEELRVRRASPVPDARDAYDELKRLVLLRLTAEIGDQLDQMDKIEARTLLQEKLDVLLVEENILLKRREKLHLMEDIVADLL
jgi:hypothetical protein